MPVQIPGITRLVPARRDELQAAFTEYAERVQAVFRATRALLGDADRKAYALHWQSHEDLESWMPGALFRLLDGRTCDDIVWRAVEPLPGAAGSTCPL